MGLNAHCRVKFVCADLRLRFLRLSTIKKCPQMLRSDHRELRNSKVKLGWVVVVVVVVVDGGGCIGQRLILLLLRAKIEIEIELRASQSLSIFV